jgi:hypothetical protein
MNRLETTALLLGGKQSAFDPAPTASAGLPVTPAKNLQMSSGARWLESPAPILKSMKMGAEARYTIFRPWCSESGAEMMGPNPRPKV